MNIISYPTNLSESVIEYFKAKNITPDKLYCKKCGTLLITEDLTNVEYTGRIDRLGYPVFKRQNISKSILTNTVVYHRGGVNGDVNSQWLLRGRVISGKQFFRHTCWKCYVNHLFATIDIAKRAKKSTYYRKLITNKIIAPHPSSAANNTFKYIFDITDDELAQEHLKYDTASKESWIRRHGAAGEALFIAYCKRQGYTASSEYFIKEKGYSESEVAEYHTNRAATQLNFVKRYGEELGMKKWIAYCNRQAYAGNKLEYFIEKFGDIVGKAKYKDICHQKGLTVTNFIRKYGEVDGRIRWLNWCDNVKVGYSKIATELFVSILLHIPKEQKYMCKFAEYGKETSIVVNDKTYFIDFTFGNKAIEFFGDYWHANPVIFAEEDINTVKKKTAKEIHENDEVRLNVLKAAGYDILVIWESDYRTNVDDTVKKCLTFLGV